MPARGRKPKPAHLHVVQGTEEKGRHAGEIEAGGELPDDPPEHLSGLAAWYWRKVVAELKALGLGSSADWFDVETLCVYYQRARNAEATVEVEGETQYDKRTGLSKRHPASTVAAQLRKEIRLMTESLGVSHIGRARGRGSSAPPKAQAPAEDVDPYERPGG